MAILLLDSFLGLLWFVFFLAVLGLGFVLFVEFIIPYLKQKAMELPDGVHAGDTMEYVVPDSLRQGRFTIGKKLSDFNTICSGIEEDHLVFDIKRNNDNEEYTITITRNGPTLYKPPRMETYTRMESKEKIEGYEIIGHYADFRIGDKIVKERMIHYIEIRLSTAFFFNKVGKERMKFIFTVLKIHPGLNREKRNRDGCFGWGQEDEDITTEESDEYEEDEDEVTNA